MKKILIVLAVIVLLIAAGVTLLGLRPDLGMLAWRNGIRIWTGADHGVVDINGERMGWLSLGKGRPIVMVHGLRGEGAAFLPLAKELSRRGYRAVAFDLPGHGRSDPPSRPLTLDSSGVLILDAAEKLGLGPRPVLLGHSLGGWMVAWQALEHPERCGPVVLAGSAGLLFDPPPLNALHPKTVADGRESIRLLFAKTPAVPAPVLWLTVRRPEKASLDLLRSAFSGRFLLDGLLQGVTTPVLVVHGAEDRLIPRQTGQRMAEEIPGSRFVLVPGAGHMLIWEDPAAVAAAVDEFLKKNPV